MATGYLLGSLLAVVLAVPPPQDLEALSARARQAMTAGQFDEAAKLYRQLVTAIPDDAGMRFNLGLSLHSAGRYREAIPELQAALKRQPDLPRASLVLGLCHLKLGEPAKAIPPLERAVKLDPRSSIARLELGDSYLSLGRPREARAHFAKLAELEPVNPKAWQGLGLSLVALSRQAYAELEKFAPLSSYRFALLGRARAEQRQFRSAFALYRLALEREPDLAGAHAALAAVYRETGHPDWAAVEEERERRLGKPDCALRRLECAFAAGRHREILAETEPATGPEALYWRARAASELALEALARLEQLPPSAELHELLARAYHVQGEERRSGAEWEKALKFRPGDRRLRIERVRSLWLNADYTAAQPELEALLRDDPDSADLNHLLGDTLLALDQAEHALPHLEKVARRRPDLLPARASLGRCYLRLGRAADAIPHLRASLAADEDGAWRYQLARAYREAGMEDLARTELAAYQALLAKKGRIEDGEITPP